MVLRSPILPLAGGPEEPGHARVDCNPRCKYTEDYLSQVKIRPEIVKRLTELMRVESYGIPVERGDKYFFKKRLPEENQGSIYVRDGPERQRRKLVDATN